MPDKIDRFWEIQQANYAHKREHGSIALWMAQAEAEAFREMIRYAAKKETNREPEKLLFSWEK